MKILKMFKIQSPGERMKKVTYSGYELYVIVSYSSYSPASADFEVVYVDRTVADKDCDALQRSYDAVSTVPAKFGTRYEVSTLEAAVRLVRDEAYSDGERSASDYS